MAMGRLFVGSVYGADEEVNKKWFGLQSHFLSMTTKGYTHFVCADRDVGFDGDYRFVKKVYQEEEFWHDIGAVRPKSTKEPPSDKYYLEHVNGLKTLIDEFRRNIEYGWMLLLDSDAFPVRAGWQNVLPQHINHKKKQWASAVRVECLDLFPHPCVWLIPRRALDVLDNLASMPPVPDICGRNVMNIGTGLSTKDALPLIKTNVWSPHPFMCTVYYGAFYHHAGGSRAPGNKSIQYYRNTVPDGYHRKFYDDVDGMLLANPEEFISRLVGFDIRSDVAKEYLP